MEEMKVDKYQFLKSICLGQNKISGCGKIKRWDLWNHIRMKWRHAKDSLGNLKLSAQSMTLEAGKDNG
jgi:hypothetical protein